MFTELEYCEFCKGHHVISDASKERAELRTKNMNTLDKNAAWHEANDKAAMKLQLQAEATGQLS